MIVFPNLTLSGVGQSGIVQPYGATGSQVGQLNALTITSLGLICTVSSGASLTYSVQLTGDSNPSETGNWNNHDVLAGLNSSMNSNILYPVSGVRLIVTVWASGSVNLGVVQWP